MRDVVFPGQNKVKDGIARHPAMVRENQTYSCRPCQNGTANNTLTRCQRKDTGAPPPRLGPPRPGTPPASPDDSERTQSSKTEGVPPGYMYIHTPLPSAPFFNLDPYAKDHMCNEDFVPDWLTDQGPSI